MGVTRQVLTKGILENLEIPFPQSKSSHLIVQEIKSRLSVVNKMEEQIKISLQQT